MKKIISLLLVLMLIIISSMTAFADNPTTIDELIEKNKEIEKKAMEYAN